MHMYAKYDLNIPRGSRVISVFFLLNVHGQTEWGTHIMVILQTQGSCNIITALHFCWVYY